MNINKQHKKENKKERKKREERKKEENFFKKDTAEYHHIGHVTNSQTIHNKLS